jgi:drug/metabolite transporter (DMT)-like permease
VQALFAAALAALASSMYALSTSLQALEARRAPASAALRSALVAQLVRRPLWLAGAAAGVLAWPLQAGALAIGSVALVQPALGLGLVVLLVLGVRLLHERVGPREVSGAVAIAWRPATPAPSTSTRAGAIVPAAVVSIGKSFGSRFAASSIAL